MCVLGTLNAIPFDKQIYIYLKVQKAQWELRKFEVWSLKFQFRMTAKNSKFQSIFHNKK